MVEQALTSMKVPGPPGVTSDLIKAAGATGVKGVFQVCKSIEQESKVLVREVGQELYHTSIQR